MTRTRSTGRRGARPIALLAAAMLGGVFGGCRVERPNPDHCFFAEGDRTCDELDPSLPFCVEPECSAAPYGCVAEPPVDGCYSPCGNGTLAGQDASCIEVSDESDTGTAETETGSGTGDELGTDTDAECISHEDCPESSPYCLLGECVGCDATPEPEEACFALTGGQATVCLEGECVECSADNPQPCIDDALVCDTDAHACIACSAHDQCAGGAGCDLALGLCLRPDMVWHVDGDGGQDFETIAEAVDAIGDGSGTIILHELDTPGYAEGVSLAGDRALALLGAEGEYPRLQMSPVSLEAGDGARLYARGLLLYGDSGAVVSGAHLELDRVRVAPAQVNALVVEDGVLRMRNSMLRSGLGMDAVLDVTGVSDIDVRYSTLVGFTDEPALLCQATLVPGSRIRNSILVNLGDTPAVQCAGLTYEGNGLEDATGFSGNSTIGDADLDWFVDLLFADFHLTVVAPVAVATAASWSEGDPLVDFDGEARPATEGSPDFAGADRLP
ncbi:hypothetical protein G6O69_12990 [Pseudenhygromyxa sp. WMMC2535]|uniref:hypothetical protein n=1 Tax=Pseudenhygromyxa sp. WMMC2535 TaxID=2712867 RepID=UPI001552EA4B|nr:hypothetical protein [Pseudenhygromyxa sp. WMMC2535]NVB38749.1 hypothetical protein [Pseudenhygromyxa sp. WMMC2535]